MAARRRYQMFLDGANQLYSPVSAGDVSRVGWDRKVLIPGQADAAILGIVAANFTNALAQSAGTAYSGRSAE